MNKNKCCVVLTIFLAGWLAVFSRGDVPDKLPERLPPALGVYTWGAAGIAKGYHDEFANWLDRPVDMAVDFQPLNTWGAIEGEIGQLRVWSKWVHAVPGRHLVLSVQLLPSEVKSAGTKSTKDIPVSLEEGAKGVYNQHFRRLAENLVKFQLEDSILRLGWEFNGGWYNYRAVKKEGSFAEYWRQIVKTMREVPGADKLKYCWNPANTILQFDARKCWPGDEYVDYVGVDVYDQSWLPDTYPIPQDATLEEQQKRREQAWSEWNFSKQHQGLEMWSSFAREHQKPLVLPEWGVCNRKDGHGGDDDVYFVEQMFKFINDPANNVYFQCYFNVNAPDGGHQLTPKNGVPTQFPNSARRFKELFGRSVASTQRE